MSEHSISTSLLQHMIDLHATIAYPDPDTLPHDAIVSVDPGCASLLLARASRATE